MAEYLTEAAYMRWYRQYHLMLRYYIEVLDPLRIRVEALRYEAEGEEIEKLMNEIEEKIEVALPRNFNTEAPLAGFEKFSENIKVLANLVRRLFHKEVLFEGIYQAEKTRVLEIHQAYKFKTKLQTLNQWLETVEQSIAQELRRAQQTG